MNKLLPIVPGCKAVIISNTPNSGKEVYVKRFIGYDIRYPGNTDLWEIEGFILSSLCNKKTGEFIRPGSKTNLVTESKLIRIDGNDEFFKSEVEEVEKELVT